MSHTEHLARSPEFLSRLHDGELTPAERVHFESHRAHCAECRRAAAEFEDALSLYRSSHPTPASPDLAARILRKLRTTSPRRRAGFGPSFGIDLRWAGAFAAAVVAAIIGSSVVARYEVRNRPSPEAAPVPVVLESARGKVADAAPPASRNAERPERGSGSVDRQAKEIAGSRANEEVAAALPRRELGAADEKKPFAPSAPEPDPSAVLQKSKKLDSLRDRVAVSAPERESDAAHRSVSADAAKASGFSERRSDAAPPARPAERLGGEGATGASGAVAESGPPAPALRLVVESMDGVRSVPDLAPRQTLALPASLKGRTFLVVVDAAGRIRQALPREAGNANAPAMAVEAQEAGADGSALLGVRFQPGDRQRRLLVRVE